MNRPEDYIKLADMSSKTPSVKVSMAKSKFDDVETASHDIHLHNDTIDTLFWDNLSVKIHDTKSGKDKYILQYIDGEVHAGMSIVVIICFRSSVISVSLLTRFAGDLVAIMGPSGSGKSTLLNVLAHRPIMAKAVVEGQILINRAPASSSTFRRAGCYVEQEDSLIGSLTARETLYFAAKLGLPR